MAAFVREVKVPSSGQVLPVSQTEAVVARGPAPHPPARVWHHVSLQTEAVLN